MKDEALKGLGFSPLSLHAFNLHVELLAYVLTSDLARLLARLVGALRVSFQLVLVKIHIAQIA